MNCSIDEGKKLASEVIHMVQDEVTNDVNIVLIPPFVHLPGIQSLIGSAESISLGAQNCHEAESGAYTGEISASMLVSVGAEYVVLGHSERREYFGETDSLLHAKILHAISHGLQPIYCCGEKLESRESGDHETVVGSQISEALFDLETEHVQKVIIAYEPVWAIGTGKTASAQQAQEMHQFIRTQLADRYDQNTADSISILYGGSVKPGNAQEIFSQPDVDGGLIGGASLKSRDFTDIVKAID